MAAGSRSGESSHWRSSRPPIGVTVASIVSSRVQPRAPARSGSTSSRLRRVISSSQRNASLRRTTRPREMRQAGRLELAQVAEQGAGRADRGGRRRGPRRGRRARRGRTGGPAPRARGRDRTPSARARCGATPSLGRQRRASPGSDDLGRAEPAERLGQARRVQRLEQELAGAEIDRPRAPTRSRRRRASATRKLFRPPASQPSCSSAPGVTVSTTSRRTRPLASFGILDLLADGDAVPGADELAEILGGGLDRHAGERHAVAARGERDVEDPRRELGVLVEHLVEVADPVEQDRLRDAAPSPRASA